jgi:protein-tyrosine phosphatase
MQQLTPYPLWLGHAGEGHDFRQVFGRGIRAVVDLALEEAPAPPPRELIYLRIPLLDGAGNDAGSLLLAVQALASLVRRHVPTLVTCGAGMSRSPSITAAALSLVYGETPESWLQRIVKDHPHDIAPAFWAELIETLATSSDSSSK